MRPSCLLLLFAFVLVPAARSAQPAYGQPLPVSERVSVRHSADVDAAVAFQFGQVCAEAADAYQTEAGLTGPTTIEVLVGRSPDAAFPNVVTDRRHSLYIACVGSTEIGQRYRSGTGPVGLLCAATAELFNPARVPGLERYLAARVGVPAVQAALGAKAWARPYDYLHRDGPDSLAEHAGDPAYLALHPQTAAAVALTRVAERLKPAGLASALRDLPGQGATAFQAFRRRVCAADPALEAAFGPWDRAVDLPRDEHGAVSVASFEDEAELALLSTRHGATVERVSDGATDGAHAAAVTFREAGYPSVSSVQEDWRFADWSGFRTFEFDAFNRAAVPVKLFVQACDAPDRGHGWLYAPATLPPGRTTHVVMHLREGRVGGEDDRPWRSAVYWDGHSRLAEMAFLGFSLTQPPAPALPVTVLLDNLRLVP